MSDLKVGQSQVFTVSADDGSVVPDGAVSVSLSDPGVFSVLVNPDNSFVLTALIEGGSDVQVSAHGFKSATFRMTVLPLPSLVVTPGEITGP